MGKQSGPCCFPVRAFFLPKVLCLLLVLQGKFVLALCEVQSEVQFEERRHCDEQSNKIGYQQDF